MIKYTVAMSIRVVCLALCIVLPGWWKIVPAAGAILLPYFAVLVANNVRAGLPAKVRRPGVLARRHEDER